MSELIIPADSKPNYDDWGPDSFWDLATWVAWHRGLVQKYGSAKGQNGFPVADNMWLDAWTKQGFGASPVIAIMQPSRFKDETSYIKKFPTLYQYSGLKKAMEQFNPFEVSYGGTQAVGNVLGGVNATVSGLGSGLKILKYAIPVAVGAALIFGGIFAYNKFVK